MASTKVSSLLALVLLSLEASALIVPRHVSVHEKRDVLHPRWTKKDRVEPHKLLPMRIGLAQSNLESGHDHLMKISDPASPQFGQHWTSEQVIEAFRPSRETEEEVRNWLIESGIPAKRITHADNKGWFAFYATAEEAENLLYTEYHEYEDEVTGGIIPSCDEYHVPTHIQQHIDYISPGIKLHAPEKTDRKFKRSTEHVEDELAKRHLSFLQETGTLSYNASDLSTCDLAITPACIAALYKIPAANSSNPNNSLGIFESELQMYSQVDLDLFFANFSSNIPNGTHPIPANIDGGQGVTLDLYQVGGEASVDLQMVYPIIYPQSITLYNTDDFIVQADQNDTYTYGFNTFLDALDGSYCNFTAYGETGNDANLDQEYPDVRIGGWDGQLECGTFDPTNVIVLSYGGFEADLPINYQKRQCLEYMKLGLQGVSFLFASGDSGIGNFPNRTAGPTGCLGPNGDIFNPTWPSTCPYVTSVGGTRIFPGHTVDDPESAAADPAGTLFSKDYATGGGFSNIYPIPDYQADAVATFFANRSPSYPYYSALSSNSTDSTTMPNLTALAGTSGGLYNRIGRGIPDVAANGYDLAIYNEGVFGLSGGTSGSVQIVAAVMNRLNEERLNAGKGPIGFLNPALYANPSMFNDITNGSNPGCGLDGFATAPGWDPVTGLGTPNYPKMLTYYMSLP